MPKAGPEAGGKSSPRVKQDEATIREKLHTLVEFNKKHNLGISFRELCEKDLGITRQRGYALLKPLPPSPVAHVETRGRKRLLSGEDINKIDSFLQNPSFDSAAVSWSQIAAEAGFAHIHWITVSRAMQERGYKKCWVCQKRWLSFPSAIGRRQYARELLSWNKEKLLTLRFRDEVHWGLTQKHKLSIIRKPSERCCSDCIQRNYDPLKKKRMEPVDFYCSATVGWDNKSELTFHTSAPASVPNMPRPHEPFIDPSLTAHGHLYPLPTTYTFIDGSNGGPNGVSNAQNSVAEHTGLEYSANPSQAPELWPIESVFRVLEQRVGEIDSTDNQVLKQALVQAWAGIDQATINGFIEQMHAKLRERSGNQNS